MGTRFQGGVAMSRQMMLDPPMKKEVKSAQIPFYKEYDELAEVTCGFG
jgi:hypothetical protein